MIDNRLPTFDFINSIIPVKIENETEYEVINKLQQIQKNKPDNGYLYNQLDYGYLCYIFSKYPDNPTIQAIIKEIFTKVGANYLYTLKVQKRRLPNNGLCCDTQVKNLFKNKEKHANTRYSYWSKVFDKNLPLSE